tara:strand:+ start:1826 stop:2797 length:972 start_codon:yes stop_codon:yes gene_type:complete
MSEEEEAIELTAQDMAVIDDVNDDYNEEETSEEVESDIVADDITSEDEYSDVEESVTEEPSSTGYSREQLDGAAAHYGLDPTKFNSDEALVNALEVVGQTQGQLHEWNQWYQQQQQEPEQYDESSEDSTFRVNLDEDYDEGLRDAIDDVAARMQQHYDGHIQNLYNTVQGQQYYVNQLQQQEQSQQVTGHIDVFNKSIQNLGESSLFGDGDYMSLETGSQEAQNMEAVYDRATVIATGYQAQGMEVPAMNDLVEQAYASVFSNEIKQQAQRRANDRVRKASARRLGSGSSVSSQTMPMSGEDPLENPLLKEFYENAMRENGTL